MRQRVIAVLLVLALCVGLTPMAFAAEDTLENSVDLNQLVSHGISLFKQLEAGGKYNSVVNTSAGTVGMGIMGWIGSSALQLLKWCASTEKGGNPAYCREVLGDALYNEVVNAPVAIASTLMPNWNYWKSRTFSSSELAATRNLLGSDVGIRCQKALAKTYILSQAKNGWKAGVRTEAGLLYYCSAENHYGEGGVKSFMRAVRNALGLGSNDLILSLNIFHTGAVRAKVSTLSYRTKVYKYLTENLGLSADPDPDPGDNDDDGGSEGGGNDEENEEVDIPFEDMPEEGHWAYDAIVWAYTNTPQITSGTSATTFSPDATLTRAEAMTFLWAAAGKPQPESTENPFDDVKESSYYYLPVLWAVEKGITSGTTATTFSPKSPVTFGQMLSFLWSFSDCPDPYWTESPFSDVTSGKYYYKPILWAYYGGILVGNENVGTLFQPNNPCSRAYVVTYLYNLFVLTAP